MIWYCLRVAPQKEQATQLILDRRGFRTFIPAVAIERRMGPRRQRVVSNVAAYPGYLFAGTEGRFPWEDIIRCTGLPIMGALCSWNGQPKALTDADLSRIQFAANRKQKVKGRKLVEAGDMAEIVSGPLKHMLVRVEKVSGDWATIEMPMVGAQKVEIAHDNLVAA
jgi:transcription antitermination factor NusG